MLMLVAGLVRMLVARRYVGAVGMGKAAVRVLVAMGMLVAVAA